jgi:hypothetical protein
MDASVRLRKLRGLYTMTAVMLLNFVVLALVLNAMAGPARRAYQYLTARHSVKELQEVYPGKSASEISLLLTETWDRPWQYEPWVGFRERPRRGRYVNVSEAGFRLTDRTGFSLDAARMPVHVFGGSTTFGYGLDDASTIPGRMQAHFDHLLGKDSVAVFNFGRGYYYSAQELALLLQLLRSGRVPRVAIFIDGVNEGQSAPNYSAEMAGMFDAYNYAPARLLKLTLESSALVRLVGDVTRLERRRGNFDGDPANIRADWLRNRRTTQSLAQGLGFSTYFFLQPVPGYRNKFARHRFMSADGVRMQPALVAKMDALETAMDGETSLSLTDMLQDVGGPAFIDDFHYTAAVSDSIAARIAGIVARDRRLRAAPHGRSSGEAAPEGS